MTDTSSDRVALLGTGKAQGPSVVVGLLPGHPTPSNEREGVVYADESGYDVRDPKHPSWQDGAFDQFGELIADTNELDAVIDALSSEPGFARDYYCACDRCDRTTVCVLIAGEMVCPVCVGMRAA